MSFSDLSVEFIGDAPCPNHECTSVDKQKKCGRLPKAKIKKLLQMFALVSFSFFAHVAFDEHWNSKTFCEIGNFSKTRYATRFELQGSILILFYNIDFFVIVDHFRSEGRCTDSEEIKSFQLPFFSRTFSNGKVYQWKKKNILTSIWA